MKNDLFSIGPFTVHGYGLMIAIGVLSAYYMVEYRAKKKQMDWEKVFPLTVWSVLGGFLGSKILYLLTRLPDILANPALLGSSIKDGFVVYGGIIGVSDCVDLTANVRNGTFGKFLISRCLRLRWHRASGGLAVCLPAAATE